MSDKITIAWKGGQLTSIGQIVGAIGRIIDGGDSEEAEQFRQAWLASGAKPEVVESDLGFLMGEFDRETMQKGLDLFKASHPVVGRTAAATDREAIALGALWAGGIKLPIEQT